MPRPIRWSLLPLVCLGGALGAGARYALTSAPSGDAASVFWATAAVNVFGSLLLGVVAGALGDWHPRWRALLGPGVLGGFTTYSAFAVQIGSLPLPAADPRGTLVVLVAALVLLAVAAASAMAGLVVGGRLVRPAKGAAG